MPSRRHSSEDLWGIVLAGGQGTRATRSRSMLKQTLQRAERVIARKRLMTVVDAADVKKLKPQLEDRSPHTIIRQPKNLDTLPGMLLPLMHILARDPEALVAVLPSDHFVLQEERFMKHIAAAAAALMKLPNRVILLGIRPDTAETGYGWIAPSQRISTSDGFEFFRIQSFREKPPLKTAEEFLRQGMLWNSFVTVARAETLHKLAWSYRPRIAERFERIRRSVGSWRCASVTAKEYRGMESANISKDVFECNPPNAAVMPMSGVLWSDWGNPERIQTTMSQLSRFTRSVQSGR